MIKVVAKHYVKQDKVNEYIENAKELVSETVKEDGCIKYELFQDEENPQILTMIEEWTDKAALDKHMVSEHFRRIIPMQRELDEKPSEINIYNKVL